MQILFKDYPEVLEDLSRGKHLSHPTVYKVINSYLFQEKSRMRHPGAFPGKFILQTTEGIIHLTYSNQVWQIDHTKLDILLVVKVKEENRTDAKLVGLSVDRLMTLLPPDSEPIRLEPIRFCPACYIEAPYHRMEWQYQSTAGCEHHQLKLLCKCPGCGTYFRIPVLWAEPKCHHCGMPFKRMVKHQKTY